MGKEKRRVLLFLILAVSVIPGTGCEKARETGKKVEAPAAQEEKAGEEEKQSYSFADVLGQVYEAELLTGIAACPYEYERLTWEKGYPYYRDEEGNVRSELGVDVSKYQQEVDWTQVKDAGISFAIVRLGFRGYGGEGKLVLDEYYEKNVEGALAAGLTVGVYFFSQAVTEEEAAEEARFVLEHIRDYQIEGPVVFDTEEIKDGEARTDNLTGAQITSHCIAFCDTVKEAGHLPMIYANMKWMAFTLELERLTAYEKWYADYEPVPQCPYEFAVWQYTESGTVPGIQGNADINVWFH